MAFAGPSRGIKNDINVTPLIDVVLVLLIIFMVVTPLLQKGKSVTLPKADSSDESKEPEALVISIPSDRTIWADNTAVSKEELGIVVAKAMRDHPGRKLLLKGDESLKVLQVREVLAIAKNAGAGQVLLGVEERGSH
jgi:biopolymer transport protein TolR